MDKICYCNQCKKLFYKGNIFCKVIKGDRYKCLPDEEHYLCPNCRSEDIDVGIEKTFDKKAREAMEEVGFDYFSEDDLGYEKTKEKLKETYNCDGLEFIYDDKQGMFVIDDGVESFPFPEEE